MIYFIESAGIDNFFPVVAKAVGVRFPEIDIQVTGPSTEPGVVFTLVSLLDLSSESLGLITISVIFILILLFRPTGLFGQKA